MSINFCICITKTRFSHLKKINYVFFHSEDIQNWREKIILSPTPPKFVILIRTFFAGRILIRIRLKNTISETLMETKAKCIWLGTLFDPPFYYRTY